jgi:hypothetical protein
MMSVMRTFLIDTIINSFYDTSRYARHSSFSIREFWGRVYCKAILCRCLMRERSSTMRRFLVFVESDVSDKTVLRPLASDTLWTIVGRVF